MNWITKLGQLLAKGQSAQFVAFFAHLGVSALITEHSGRFHWYAFALFVIGGAAKEIWDIYNEHDPPQTFMDSFEDWIGWLSGATLGLGFVVGWW